MACSNCPHALVRFSFQHRFGSEVPPCLLGAMNSPNSTPFRDCMLREVQAWAFFPLAAYHLLCNVRVGRGGDAAVPQGPSAKKRKTPEQSALLAAVQSGQGL